MKCPHCECELTCSGCQAPVQSAQLRWQQRRIELGMCRRCGQERTGRDLQFSACQPCRTVIAAQSRRRHARRGGRRGRA